MATSEGQADQTVLHKIAKWIGGATAVLVALGVGAEAYDKYIATKEAVTPAFTSFKKPNGYLRMIAHKRWEETGVGGETVNWEEVSRKDGMVVLYDQSRGMYLRFPFDGGQAQWANDNPMIWTDLFLIEPIV